MADRGMPSRFASELAPPDEVRARVRSVLAATPAAQTSTRLRLTLALLIVPIVTVSVLLTAAHLVYDRPALRVDMATHPTSERLLVVLGLALSATLVAIGRGKRGLGSRVTSLYLVALLAAPLYAVLTLWSPPAADQHVVAALAELSPWGLRCLPIAATVGVLVLVSFTAALRRSSPVASRLRGAALGAAAGAWAGLGVLAFCPATEPCHLLVGHVLPSAAFTLLGLGLVPRALRP